MTVEWSQTSPADYDRRRAVRGHKRDSGEQASLFYVATPTAEARPGQVREELPGQGELFGDELDALEFEDCATCGKPASQATGGRHAVTREGSAREGWAYSTQCVACWNASVEASRAAQVAARRAAPRCEGCGRGQQSYVMMPGTSQATALCRGCKARVDARIRVPLLFGMPSATRAQMLAAARGQS